MLHVFACSGRPTCDECLAQRRRGMRCEAVPRRRSVPQLPPIRLAPSFRRDSRNALHPRTSTHVMLNSFQHPVGSAHAAARDRWHRAHTPRLRVLRASHCADQFAEAQRCGEGEQRGWRMCLREVKRRGRGVRSAPPLPAVCVSASLRLCVSASLHLCVSASLRLCASASLRLLRLYAIFCSVTAKVQSQVRPLDAETSSA